MKVLLIRHTHAVDGDAGLPDEARWLSAKGRKLARAVGKRLRADGHQIDALVTSPLVRAVQTAELVADGAHFRGEVQSAMELAPGGSLRRAADALAGLGATVAAVGHEPGISALAAQLAGRGVQLGAMKKGGVVVIDDGRLVASIDPDDLV